MIRLLINHPKVEIAFIHSKSNAGNPVYTVHQDLIGETDLKFSTEDNSPLGDGSIDVLFLCLGHGDSKKFLSENVIADNIKVIDLANDFRLTQIRSKFGNRTRTRNFIYGLPELNREQIKSAHNIAIPVVLQQQYN